MIILNWVIDNILTQTAIFMGIIAICGLVVQKKSIPEIIEGFFITCIGYVLFNQGVGVLCNAIFAVNDILLPTVAAETGVYPNSDSVMNFSYTISYIGQNIMQVFIIAWFIHIILVKVFNKYFKAVYLTVHMMLNMVACNMLFWHGFLGYKGLACYVPTIIVCVLYWCISPMLCYKEAMEMSDGSFVLGHLQQIGAALGGKLASLVGDPEKDDADNLELPGWLSMFSSTILNLAVTTPLIFIIIGAIALIVGNAQAMEALAVNTAGTNWVIWMTLQGFIFTAGVAILQYGLRMFLGALVPAFQGFSEKILPGCVPAIDCVAFFSYSPMGVIFAFIAYAIGGIIVSVASGMVHSPIFILPSFVLAFFDGGSIGVFANHKGGWKGCLLAGFVCGVIMHIGSGILVTLLAPECAANGLTFGNFDTNFMCTILFWIVSKFA